ncbi:unnamed protein product [Tilletia controversa]|uniref:BTB domain-containing protein n=3 Tax=Tilletia TaxID=13289 RepID=A0A8X7MT10_9BASI|nr:hypothetical protein CF336_g3938 [Tilletia laevis]KAE8197222.1 hypothetical protein CF328_g3912 [Tilletia controversa]KAE8258503.1 hypothetical protein A4X03_0g4358 [Tilletia caries]KAE8198341.1 hypothetical protein CF335_g4405 [Tilletia laevis]KAE8247663.1 hypothetical protein A4X06_0g4289 [Tilletia controversa]
MAPPAALSLLECWEQRDLQRFRVVLKGGNLHDRSNHAQPSTSGGGGSGGGGSGSYARSPPGGHSASWGRDGGSNNHNHVLGPAPPSEVNRRDEFGRTSLHLVCASPDGIAIDFLHALLSHPSLNVNLQDFESGYTALHLALYAGNLHIALTLLRKADTDLRVKDFEGLTPFDLYNSTISGTNPRWTPEIGGSELFTWGVNRNFTLGLGDGDDRALPKSVLLNKVYDGYALKQMEAGARYDRLRIRDVAMSKLHTVVLTTERSGNVWVCGFGGNARLGRANQSQTSLEPLKDFHDSAASVAVAQDHTVILSTNGDVYTYGQNKFAQLGYVLEKGQGIVGSTTGNSGRGGGAPTATFSGSSSNGPQLGGSLGNSASAGLAGAIPGSHQGPLELDLQISPRKVSGVLKKEYVKGAAASKIHTAVFTSDALYTWGTNTGQLGYDRSATPVQVLPRKVTSITAAQPIKQIAATEFATAVVLESDEVIVFHNDGQFRLQFPATPTTRFPAGKEVYTSRRVQRKIRVGKITSSGTTFAALSDSGDLFTFSLEHPSEYVKSGGNHVRPEVSTIWSVRRKFTAVRDVAIGGDGSIILSTESGHVFVRERRVGGDKPVGSGPAKFSKTSAASSSSSGKNAFKFHQIPYLQRVVKVATNESGGWAAIKADAPLRDIRIRGRSIEEDLQSLLPHLKVRDISQHGFEEEREISVEVVEADRRREEAVGAVGGDEEDVESSDGESENEEGVSHRHLRVGKLLGEAVRRWGLSEGMARDAYGPNNLVPPFGCDMFVIAEGRYIPAHRIIFAVRVPALRDALASAGSGSVPDGVRVDHVTDSVVTLTLPNCGFPTAVFLLHYLYTNDLPAVWTTSIGLQIAAQYQASKMVPAVIQSELLELVQSLELQDSLRSSLTSPNPRSPPHTLRKDMETLFETQVAVEASSSSLRDTELILSDRVVPCHSVILRRSPFYADFFRPEWTSTRFENGRIQVNMQHLRWEIARLLLLHLYTDAGVELFKEADQDRTPDQFIDFVLEVLAAADEWALAKMKQVCSLLLRRRVVPTNVSAMMTDADTFNAIELKEACMLQTTQTMESLLETGMLDELEGKQLRDLTSFVRQKQDERIHRTLASDRILAVIMANQDEYDRIVQELKSAKQRAQARPRKASVSVSVVQQQQMPTSPEMRPHKAHADDSLIFEMDEDLDTLSQHGSPSLSALSNVKLSSMPAWAPLPGAVRGASQQAHQQPAALFGRSPPSFASDSGAQRASMTWAAKSNVVAEAPTSTPNGVADFRSIMASEKARRPGPTTVQPAASTPGTSTASLSSWRQPSSSSGSTSLTGSGAATPQPPPSPSLLPVNFTPKLSQKDRRKQAMLQSQRQSSSGTATPTAIGGAGIAVAARGGAGVPYSVVSGGSPGLSTTPTGTPWRVPSSATPGSSPAPGLVNNPVSPLAARTRESTSSAAGVSAAGTTTPTNGSPWKSPPPSKNISLPSPSPSSLPKAREAVIPSSSSFTTPSEIPSLISASAPRTPSKFSFAQIQEQQQHAVDQDLRRASNVKKSFAEIVEEERRREDEERVRRAEAAEFERWFESESRRVQEARGPAQLQLQAPSAGGGGQAEGEQAKEKEKKGGRGRGGRSGGSQRGASQSASGGSRRGHANANATAAAAGTGTGTGTEEADCNAQEGAAQGESKASSRGRSRGGRGRGRGGRGGGGGGGGSAPSASTSHGT